MALAVAMVVNARSSIDFGSMKKDLINLQALTNSTHRAIFAL
jgi:hypothetical protein